MSSTDICNFCEEKVEILWQKVQSWLIEHNIEHKNCPLSQLTCLGFVNKTKGFLVHHALLLGRFHIYSSKLNNQTFDSFHNRASNVRILKSVMHTKRTQQKNSKQNGNLILLRSTSIKVCFSSFSVFTLMIKVKPLSFLFFFFWKMKSG